MGAGVRLASSWANGLWLGQRLAKRKGEQRPRKGNGLRGKEMEQAINRGRRKNLSFFLISFQSNFEDKIQIKFKFEFKSNHSKNLYAAA